MTETDTLIIGSGIAGLSAALACADNGISSTIISCGSDATVSNSWQAQGGIIYKGATGGPDELVEDILKAGCGINHVPAARQLAELGPRVVESILLKRARIDFDRTPSDYHLTREGAHSEARILHKGDQSGEAILAGLDTLVRHSPLVTFTHETTAVNLLMTSYHDTNRSRRHERSRCFGAFVFDQKAGEVYPIFAKNTILATGGIGELYLYHTNSSHARGDGLALGQRAGCRLANLEYVQFHPTTFFHPTARRFLISEALRGEGAILLNQRGERFLYRYLPGFDVPELAPRDKVAWAIHQEILRSEAPCVYLDISHKPAEWAQERFPFVYRNCLAHHVDITREPIPVIPSAHYHCGGIWTDLNGRTSLNNLWAVGEVACTGLHGANRLASTSLLEGLVWGTQAGEMIAGAVQNDRHLIRPEIEPWHAEKSQVDPAFLKQDWFLLKSTMWNYAGLIKTNARLERAEGILSELYRGIDQFYQRAALSDDLIGLRHATTTALLILEACKKNPRSLGCYLREERDL
ncbi:MAG: FAD-binding protein [Deltaproteobacteria bacterium]|nr:FAD-binding protein [Deltaproteobacteria bacterium]MBI3293139.1 FAD-binding protein [Deltaproteobacteria bacterium]